MAKKVVVLGGTGFIGQSLLRVLAPDPSIDLFWTARPQSPLPHIADIGPPIIIDDIETLDLGWLNEADVLVDLVSRGRGRFSSTRDINLRIRGHCRLIDGLINLGGKVHYLHISSGGTIYGAAPTGVLREDTPLAPSTEYGVEKAIIELHLGSAAHMGMPVSILRVANAYGLGQKMKPGFGVIPALVNALEHRTPFQIFGSGNTKRDYVNVVDIVAAICAAIETKGIGTVNIGTATGTSVLDLIALLTDLSGRSLDVAYVSPDATEPPDVVLDNQRAAELLGWEPSIDLRSGIRSILAENRMLRAGA